MALFEIATLGTFAKLLLAARKLAEDGDPLDRLKALADLAENGGKLRVALSERNLGPLAARIEADCEAADAAFERETAFEDARTVFRDAAAVALTRCDMLARNGLERTIIVQDMVEAVAASDHARDFRETDLAETYFRAVMDAGLKAMLADAGFIDGLTPQLWRETLARQGVVVELLREIRTDTKYLISQVDTLSEAISSRKPVDEIQKRAEIRAMVDRQVMEQIMIQLEIRARDIQRLLNAINEEEISVTEAVMRIRTKR